MIELDEGDKVAPLGWASYPSQHIQIKCPVSAKLQITNFPEISLKFLKPQCQIHKSQSLKYLCSLALHIKYINRANPMLLSSESLQRRELTALSRAHFPTSIHYRPITYTAFSPGAFCNKGFLLQYIQWWNHFVTLFGGKLAHQVLLKNAFKISCSKVFLKCNWKGMKIIL